MSLGQGLREPVQRPDQSVQEPSLIRRLWPSRLAARLTLLMVITASLSVCFVAAAMLYMAWQAEQSEARREARKDAQAVASSLSAPTALANRAAIRDVLRMTSHRPEKMAVWVRDSRGRILAQFGEADLPPESREGGGLRDGWLVVTEAIRHSRSGAELGTVTLRMDLGDTVAELRGQAFAAAMASLVALVLAVLLSRHMARRVSVPMVKLAEAANALTRDREHRQRLDIAGPGEIGSAIAAYDRLVEELASRDEAVQKLTQELREALAVAEAARVQAESASVAKTRFLANMSHELRSPLNGVIGAAQLLRKADRDPVFRDELVRIIQTSGKNLLDLIEGVLDVSRIEAGCVHPERQPFCLIECLEAALVPAVAGARARNLDIEFHVDSDVPAWCVGDAGRLKQLLLNLLDNAVKFTESGSVGLEVTRGTGEDQLLFHVTDTGAGIAPHLLEAIFGQFQQGDPSTTRRFGGSGLGLAICRDVSRLMGGDVTVRSSIGAGSCFTLTLPLPVVDGVASTALPLQTNVRCHEPLPRRRRSLAALLQRLGCKFEFVEDAASAAATARAADSAGAAWLIAAEAPDGPAVVQAVLSSGTSPRVATLGLLGGTSSVSESLRRPVTLSSLQAFLAAEQQVLPVGAVVGVGADRSLRSRVLLVEDDAVNRLVVSSLIEGKDVECVVAASGTEALQRLARDRFDAVLMDWQMPDMDGLEVTRRLRAGVCGELNRTVPVIALTANAFAEDRNACMAAGMNDFLTKPVQLQALRQCVLRWCRHTDAMVVEKKMPQLPEGSAPGDYEPAVLAALVGDVEGEPPEQLRSLLQMFLDSAHAAFSGMGAAIAEADWSTLQRHAHNLKSSAGQVGAMAMSANAAALERRLRAGEPGKAADLEQLRGALNRFIRAAGLADDQRVASSLAK